MYPWSRVLKLLATTCWPQLAGHNLLASILVHRRSYLILHLFPSWMTTVKFSFCNMVRSSTLWENIKSLRIEKRQASQFLSFLFFEASFILKIYSTPADFILIGCAVTGICWITLVITYLIALSACSANITLSSIYTTF